MAESDKTISVIESWLKLPVLTPPPINALYDALELLKEYQKKQEGLIPAWQDRMQEHICQKCGGIVWYEDNYCSKCGQAVKWYG